MFTLIQKLHRKRLLTSSGLFYLLEGVFTTGGNLMLLLRLAAKLHPNRLAIVDEREQLTYDQLWKQAEYLASILHQDYGIGSHQKIAVICRNHAAAIKTIFAISRLGAHCFLINPDMSAEQLQALENRLAFDFVILDKQVAPLFDGLPLKNKTLAAYASTDESVDRITSNVKTVPRLKRTKKGTIVVMTSGITGQPKLVRRKPSAFDYLPLFFDFLTQADLDEYQLIHIATPICHGYGLAFLLIAIALGAQIYMTERFDAVQSCSLIETNKIQVVILVPMMLKRMLEYDPDALSSLQRIITGSAPLSPTLAQKTLAQLGQKLFNLYGTSEAGFSIMGTPDILDKKSASIGRPIRGVRVKIVDAFEQDVPEGVIGRLYIRSAWASDKNEWTDTDDLAYRDSEGTIFLCGRADDMIISGGENVYPAELESVLARHPDIESVAVFGIPDQEFGQRLMAVVVKKHDTMLTQTTLLAWLKPRVARYQMPAIIDFRDKLPYTSFGKLDRKSLHHHVSSRQRPSP